jgi:hypothetical protein
VDPVPDPLPFFSGSAGNRTRAPAGSQVEFIPHRMFLQLYALREEASTQRSEVHIPLKIGAL